MVMGGHTPGRAELAARAFSKGTFDDAFQTCRRPVFVLTEVAWRLVGHGWPDTPARFGRPIATFSSGTEAESAIWPIRCLAASGSGDVLACAMAAISSCSPGGGSAGAGATDLPAAGLPATGIEIFISRPSAISAPTIAPADVPTIRSAVERFTPRCAKPAASPVSHALPTGPPPPSTRALPWRCGADGCVEIDISTFVGV
jgi:hypothetical protein